MTMKEEEKKYELILKFEQEKHKLKMEELQFLRDTEKIKHQWELERMRIKSAEIKRAQERTEYLKR